MLFLRGGLHEDEAVFWLVAVDANLVLVANDLLVILVELVAEERELKLAFVGEGAVALPPVQPRTPSSGITCFLTLATSPFASPPNRCDGVGSDLACGAAMIVVTAANA